VRVTNAFIVLYCIMRRSIRGGSLERGRQMRVWSSKMAIFASFARYDLPNFHTQGHNYYIFKCQVVAEHRLSLRQYAYDCQIDNDMSPSDVLIGAETF